MSTPIVGSLVSRYSLAIFFQSMGASGRIRHGRPTQHLSRTAPSVGLLPLRRRLESAAPRVSRGEPLHAAFMRGMPAYISAAWSPPVKPPAILVALCREPQASSTVNWIMP
jgi:hypothetical protein